MKARQSAKSLLGKFVFICMRTKLIFYFSCVKRFTLSLAFMMRFAATRNGLLNSAAMCVHTLYTMITKDTSELEFVSTVHLQRRLFK